MKHSRWHLIETMYHAALEQEPEARTAYLAQSCSGDEELRREVEALLKYDGNAASFIETPALELEARVGGEISAEELAQESRHSPMPSRIGPYKLISPLGKGGMGEVHLALDTRLNRKVAIKVLSAEFTADRDRVRRFEREARAASALNHPNILTVHEIDQFEGRHYLVTEHIEGETLRQLIAKAPQQRTKLRETLEIATQVAGALRAAHDAGIIHRDIKPENVMVRRDGLVKVLDFGLAKLNNAPADSQLTTVAKVNTRTGIVMGTASYMSPEQARGLKVDHRTDLFSLGVVISEMLAGQRPFEGPTASDVIAAILTTEPASLARVVPEVPAGLRRIVGRCLEKPPEKRFQSAADLAFALEEMSLPSGSNAAVPQPDVSQRAPNLLARLTQWRLSWLMAVAAGAFFLLAAVLAVIHLREQPEAKLATAFTIAPPEGWSISDFPPSVSPDGKYIAFSAFPKSAQAGQAIALWIRRLDSTEAKILPGTEGAYVGSAFWSPDSHSVAFWADGRLRRIDISGGSAVTLSDADFSKPGTWNQEGTILFHRGLRLGRVAASGGQAITLNPFAQGETAQSNPRFLPDGKHFLYYSQNRDPQGDGVYVASLEQGEGRKLVLTNAAVAMYVSTGYLLFNRGDVLMAQRFDLKRFELTGEPVRVAGPIQTVAGSPSQTPTAAFSASESGVLLWNVQTSPVTQLTWFDRSGKSLGTVGDPSEYSGPVFSPDEDRLAVARLDPKTKTRDLWIMNLLHGGATRLTFDQADDFNPEWTPDGKWIIFTSTQKGPRSMYRKLADGTGEVEPLFESDDAKHVEDISPDGRFLIFNTRPPGNPRPDISVLSLTGERKRTSFLSSPFWEDSAQFSPNGRWVAYRSNETDASEVFVRGFAPDGSASAGKWQVSNNIGSQPRWAADGKEIFYLQANTLMVAAVNTDDGSFSAGTPRPLFSANMLNFGRNSFLVTRDGQRFLVVVASAESTIAVKTNWLSELKP